MLNLLTPIQGHLGQARTDFDIGVEEARKDLRKLGKDVTNIGKVAEKLYLNEHYWSDDRLRYKSQNIFSFPACLLCMHMHCFFYYAVG